jgi:hypothetical protein
VRVGNGSTTTKNAIPQLLAQLLQAFPDGNLPSRNRHFDAYSDEDSKQAVRVFRQLFSLRRDLAMLQSRGESWIVDEDKGDGKDSMIVRYVRPYVFGMVRREARLSKAEWNLLVGLFPAVARRGSS